MFPDLYNGYMPGFRIFSHTARADVAATKDVSSEGWLNLRYKVSVISSPFLFPVISIRY